MSRTRAAERTYPEVWRLGENLADDRFDIIPGEDRRWDPSMVDDYLPEVAEDTVKLVEATARRQGGTAESGALATVGTASGYTLEPNLREYIRTGAPADDYGGDREVPRRLRPWPADGREGLLYRTRDLARDVTADRERDRAAH